jgi:DNA repair protein SbcC/Rad50
MILGLDIKNIQSHKDTHLNFHRGVNIIVGKSDAGKSAIIRSLKLVRWNRPSGNDIRSHWGGPSSVGIRTREGTVVRIKDKAEEYQIQKDLKVMSFKAFRTDVPDEVKDLLAIEEVNLQLQLDQPFLLSRTPGEVASYFNRVAKLDKIDIGTTNVQKCIREITQSLKFKRVEKATLLDKLDKFEYLKQAEVQMEALEELEKRFLNLNKRKSKLMDLCASYYDKRIQIDLLSYKLELEEPINKILGWYKEKEELYSKAQKLLSLYEHYVSIDLNIQDGEKLTKLEKPIRVLIQLYTDKEELESKRNRLNSLITSHKSITQRIKRSELNHKTLLAKYVKEFPQVCPLCGIPVPHDHEIKL